MAQTKSYAENRIIFKLGDTADAMYIVRKGSVKIFLAKDNSEISLAILQEGAIFGEMAFFDNQPRSASARCLTAAELTEISKQDFQKLLTQIPKWLYTMIQSLSLRLRTTNERLKDVESKLGSGVMGNKSISVLAREKYPFQHTLNGLKIVLLSFSKDGEKFEKEICIVYENPKSIWEDFFFEDKDMFDKIIKTSVKVGFFTIKPSPKNILSIYINNKNSLSHFINTATLIAKKLDTVTQIFSATTIQMFQEILELGQESLNNDVSLSFQGILEHMKKAGKETKDWDLHLEEIAKIPEIEIVKNGNDILIKLKIKEHKTILNYIRILKKYHVDGLV